jgi:hypothetical protein
MLTAQLSLFDVLPEVAPARPKPSTVVVAPPSDAPFAPGQVLTVRGEALKVNRSHVREDGRAEVSFRIEPGTWWVTLFVATSTGWRHVSEPERPARAFAPDTRFAEALAARNAAYDRFALLREVGDDDWEALREFARCQRRMWELSGVGRTC